MKSLSVSPVVHVHPIVVNCLGTRGYIQKLKEDTVCCSIYVSDSQRI